MKYLIVGLGNIGSEYANTRHNIGFLIAEAFAKQAEVSFTDDRYGAVSEVRIKGRTLVVLKPNTYMNLSGKAVRYWSQKLAIPNEQIMVLLDDLNLPFGKIKIKPKGSDGGHNGLKSIQELLGTDQYPRLRFGIGSEFKKGQQVDYVLGEWSEQENETLPALIKTSTDAILAFVFEGLERTMTKFNK